MKTIVTHFAPDLDAICSVWLLKTFVPDLKEAAIAFVPAGKTLNGMVPDGNPDIIHVDTGFGKFDHHQTSDDTCAALLVYQSLGKRDEALERLLHVVNDVDHFKEVFYPNPTADFYDLSLPVIIDGLQFSMADNPVGMMERVMDCLDGIYKMFQNKVWAEKDITENAIQFDTKFGKAFGIETVNREVVHYGQKMGFILVVRKDPKNGNAAIKTVPKDDIDLTAVYESLLKKDPTATWFLHPSHHMLLNGSAKNPDMKPTTLSLEALIAEVKTIYG